MLAKCGLNMKHKQRFLHDQSLLIALFFDSVVALVDSSCSVQSTIVTREDIIAACVAAKNGKVK